MTPVRRAALKVEMAEGRVQALRSSVSPDPVMCEEATMTLEGERAALRLAVEAATGCDVATLRRALNL